MWLEKNENKYEQKEYTPVTWNTFGAKAGVTNRPGTAHQPMFFGKLSARMGWRSKLPNIENLAKRGVLQITLSR